MMINQLPDPDIEEDQHYLATATPEQALRDARRQLTAIEACYLEHMEVVVDPRIDRTAFYSRVDDLRVTLARLEQIIRGEK